MAKIFEKTFDENINKLPTTQEAERLQHERTDFMRAPNEVN